jgi:mono/diheme cytochrome c family protein
VLRSAACSEDSNDRKDKGEDKDDRLQRIEGHREKANASPSRILTVSVPAVVLLLTLGIAAAQTENSAPARKNNPVYAELAKAPKKAIARPNPLEADPDAAAAGAKLSDLHCAECHGEMAEGGKKAPSLLADEVHPAVLAHDERPPFATLPLHRHPIGVLR